MTSLKLRKILYALNTNYPYLTEDDIVEILKTNESKDVKYTWFIRNWTCEQIARFVSRIIDEI